MELKPIGYLDIQGIMKDSTTTAQADGKMKKRTKIRMMTLYLSAVVNRKIEYSIIVGSTLISFKIT